MKVGRWDNDATDISLSGVFDPKTAHSSCILRILVKQDLVKFKKRLYEMKQLTWYPLFLPAIIIELKIQELPQVMTRIRRFLYRVEKITGTHKNYLRRLGLTKSTGRSLREVGMIQTSRLPQQSSRQLHQTAHVMNMHAKRARTYSTL